VLVKFLIVGIYRRRVLRGSRDGSAKLSSRIVFAAIVAIGQGTVVEVEIVGVWKAVFD